MNNNRWQPRKYNPAAHDQAAASPVTKLPPGSMERINQGIFGELPPLPSTRTNENLPPLLSKHKLIDKLSALPPSYIIAWILLLLLVLTACFGTYLMPRSIDASQKFPYLIEVVDGENVYSSPPLKASSDFWLGTDHRGIDLFSLLLNGMKYTLGFTAAVVLCRYVIGIPLGLLASFSRWVKKAVDLLYLVTASVPALILLFPALSSVYYLLYMDSILPGDEWKRTLFNVIMFVSLSVVGIGPVTKQVAERARHFASKPFVAAARMMGASRARISWRHLLPNMRVEILFASLADLVQVMFLLGQLGVLGLYLGGAEVLDLEDGMPTVKTSRTGEWSAMIAYGSRYIQMHSQILLGTAVFFIATVAILKFYLSQLQKLHTPNRGE